MLVDNTLDLDCLIQALENYMSAKREHDEARDAYQGESWGYHGSHYVEAVEEAAKEFRKRLQTVVAAEVKKALAARCL